MKERNLIKNDKTEDIRMVTDFKDELERIKQKLAKDFNKYSELEKMKNKQKLSGRAVIFRKSEVNNEDKEINEIDYNVNEIENNDISMKKEPFFENLNYKYGLDRDNYNKVQENEQNEFTNYNKYKTFQNNISSINTRNLNPLDYNMSFRKKYTDISNEEEDLNFSFTNDINKQRNLSSDNNPKIINNNINININNNSSLILDSKLDQQIKFIDEKSENNRIQEEKTIKKIRQIENSLQLEERLIHNNREIRKNAIKELTEMCQKDFQNSQDKQKMFEFFSPWIKYCLGETNSYVIPESLNFFFIFNSLFPGFLSISMKDFFDNVERFISFGVYGINELSVKIFLMMFEDKKLCNQAFNELMKLLINSSSLNVYKFIQELILILLNKNLLQENYIKILFEKIILIYIKINKNNEKKRIFSQLIKNIYNYLEDDYQDIKQNIKLSSYKELDSLFEQINSSNMKKNFITYTLYPRPIQTEIDNLNNYNNYFNIADLNDRLKTESNNNSHKFIFDKKNKTKTPEKRNLGNVINSKGEVNDIMTILPNEFFEYHFEVQFQTKIQILEKANELLNRIKFVKEKERNIIDVYKIVNISIDDSNILIHLEGIKLLENICRLINEFINKQKLKLILITCFAKLKDKKSIVKNELFKLFNIVIEYNCFELNKFISFILLHCLNEKNDNIKLGLLEFIKSVFSQENLKILKYIDDLTEKEYIYYSKKLVNIITKESLSLTKDLCSEILIIIKRRILSPKVFNEIIDKLPTHRKRIIQKEEEEINNSIYKNNFRQKKSSYSLSNIKNNYHRNKLSISSLKSNNSSFRNDSINSNKTTNIKKFKKINLYSTNNYKFNNIRNVNKKDIFNDKMNISFNNSPKRKRKIIKDNENDDYKLINKTEINEDDKLNNNNKAIFSSKKSKENDSLSMKKNNLIKSIETTDEESIEKFSKIIIKDFLSFIKKITIQQNQDLTPHFELIFIIYEKIFQRIFYLMGKNKNIKQNMIKLKKLMDELMNYISKVLILTPGIEQIKGSKKFEEEKLEKYLSIFKNFCFNEEKFYMNLLLNLYKLCDGKDEDFPKNYNAKISVLFYLTYVKKANKELNSKKILNILKEFIAETNILDLEEKNNLLDDIQLTDINYENEMKLINQLKSQKKEENKKVNHSSDDSISDSEESLKEKKTDIKLKIEDEKEDEKDNDNSKIKSYDFNEIEKSIRLFSNSLNKLPIKGLRNKDKNDNSRRENTDRNISPNNTNKLIDNYEIKKNMSALNIPFSILKNKLTLNNTKKLSLNLPIKEQLNQSFDKINKSNNNINNSNKEILKTEIEDNRNKNDIHFEKTEKSNKNNYNYILNQIIKALNNEITEEGIFNTSLIQFFKLTNNQKLEFINTLQNQIQQKKNLLQNTSINILLNFNDYILSILSFQILKFPKEESLIIKIQNFIQNIINIRNIDDMLKVMLFLLKKYFPKDLNQKIQDMALIMLKIIAYFLKELLKKAKNQKIKGKNLICEINDLFINTPPSNLTTKTPNCSLYQNIFTLLKSITDEIAFQNKDNFSELIQYLKEKQIVCEEYVQYLLKLNNSLNK